MAAPPARLADGGYVVDTVPLSALVVMPSGRTVTQYFVTYVGYGRDEGTWELRNRMNAAAIVADVQPLEAQLAKDALAELQEHHVSTLTGLYTEVRRRVGKADGGEDAEDRGCSVFVRMQQRTAARLFTRRLDYLARHTRKGRVESRRWVFANTASFYLQVFPKKCRSAAPTLVAVQRQV